MVAKSLLVGQGWNIGHGPKTYVDRGNPLAFSERTGEALLFSEAALASEAAFAPRRLQLPNPDPYHLLEAPEGSHLGLLRQGCA